MIAASDILSKVAPTAKKNYSDAFKDPANLLAEHEITTPLRIGHFLAQVMHETGGGQVLAEKLNYTTEARLLQIFGAGRHSAAIQPGEVHGLLGNPEKLAERVYGLGNPKKARELGNLKPGDGYKYRGRGALQTTGGANYRRASIACDVDYYGHPDLMVSSDQLLKPALDEWTQGNLNTAADRNDIRTITKTINGGYIGIDERMRWFETIWPVASGIQAPWEAAIGDDDTRWLQNALNGLGARPVLTVDGRYGPATTEAVKWFQVFNDLKADGIAGDVTRASIRLRLAAIRGG
jgi:putative chitinase